MNLRPGTYSITFTLTGFSSFVRTALTLPSDFTATVNAEMRVGTLEETVTVSGQAPVVDVESTQRTTVLSRQILDSVPTGRTYAAAGALVVGVRVSEPNVGGTRTGSQQRLVAYGSLAKDVTVEVDGMKSGGIEAGGDDQQDHNDGMTAEVIVRTTGSSADVAYGGPYMNLIPREGGNQFSGANYFGYTNRSWQSDNLGELHERGLNNPDSVDMIYYANVSVGGPIVRNKLWFFGLVRQQRQQQHRQQQLLSGRLVPASSTTASRTTPSGSRGRRRRRTRLRSSTTTPRSSSVTSTRRVPMSQQPPRSASRG